MCVILHVRLKFHRRADIAEEHIGQRHAAEKKHDAFRALVERTVLKPVFIQPESIDAHARIVESRGCASPPD